MVPARSNARVDTMIAKTVREIPARERVKIKQKPQIASEMKEKGICSTCNHMSTCIYLKKAEQPIYFCEEFDDYISSEITNLFQSIPSQTEFNKNREYSSEIKGLCINCDNNQACYFQIRTANISYCEEYQ